MDVQTRFRRRAGVAIAVAVITASAALVTFRPAGPPGIEAAEAAAPTPPPPPRPAADAPSAPTGRADPGPGADPHAAASGFLTAEAHGDLDTAFSYLAAEERETLGSVAAYRASHADLLGTVTGFALRSVEADPDDPARATVVARVGFVPTLDPVVGLVPAIGTVSLPVVDDDGWRVALAGLVVTPELPDDDRAADAGAAYLAGAIACAVEPAPETLLGRPGLIGDLCGSAGAVDVGTVAPIDDPVVAQPFLAAYGADVTDWGRVLTVLAPRPLRLVLAPYGAVWRVIGALPPT